jgi:di/tricarboxylate transporter
MNPLIRQAGRGAPPRLNATTRWRVKPYALAVPICAACDFFSPIGRQCNTLVIGPEGYRFGDYWRLGLPLSILILLPGVPLILLVWPLA